MSVYWLTEALPMGITSLLPVLCFPLLGILPSERVTEGYFKVSEKLNNLKRKVYV